MTSLSKLLRKFLRQFRVRRYKPSRERVAYQERFMKTKQFYGGPHDGLEVRGDVEYAEYPSRPDYSDDGHLLSVYVDVGSRLVFHGWLRNPDCQGAGIGRGKDKCFECVVREKK